MAGGASHPARHRIARTDVEIDAQGDDGIRQYQIPDALPDPRVTPFWNLLVGFPGETAEVYARYEKVLPDLFHLPPPSGVFPVRFDRFSPYFNTPDDFGLNLKPFDFYEFCYPFPEQSLNSMAYYFHDTNYEAKYLGDLAAAISSLRQIIDRWHASWVGDNAAAAPRLLLRPDAQGHVVEDTRSGTLVRIPVSPRNSTCCTRRRAPSLRQIVERFGETLMPSAASVCSSTSAAA